MRGLTYNDQLRVIAAEYRQASMPWPAQLKDIAAWAIDQQLWKPYPSAVINRLAEDFGRAMREEYFTDAQGRSVRAKHAARVLRGGQQLVLWDDIRTAPWSHMQVAFQQRRQQIVSDCRQLKIDADSYNENTNPTDPIQLVFDFTDDLLELDALVELNS